MKKSKEEMWERFKKYYTEFPEIGLALDLSRVNFPDDSFQLMEPRFQKAFRAMAELEKGAIANPDEGRMVGHYWLRNPSLAPSAEIRREIEETISEIESFTQQVHSGKIQGAGGVFLNLLLIGIGGSALGPQFVSNALGDPRTDKLSIHFFDNTDPDGMDRVLEKIGNHLDQTLCLVISKSGGTKETRNGMLEAEAAYKRQGFHFAAHAIAVTGFGSDLDQLAEREGWLKRFPMWDWVGGRVSETSAVGLLPAALQGFDIRSFLRGAATCDEVTRQMTVQANPAAQLATAWFLIGNGKGAKDLVVLPYKDRLELFSRYLQQLVMESLGKEFDLNGDRVNQGLAVYGNKGSTDQHAYVQQLRDGLNNFFVTFIQVLRDRKSDCFFVEPGITSGDYLNGFLFGTRWALADKERDSITITLTEVSAFSIGSLIALFERTVGLYASLININPYHQPGVEAGKKAAESITALQRNILSHLEKKRGRFFTVQEIAHEIEGENSLEDVFRICQHLAANPDRGMEVLRTESPFDSRYRLI